MADKTGIEWADATWNPIVGCSIVSPGCTNCYAMAQAARIERMQPGSHYAGTTQPSKAGPVWTGKLALAPEHILTAPLRWRRPRRIFVNSMGDLFHEAVPDAWIDRVFDVMASSGAHTFQVLTKRADRMRRYVESLGENRARWQTDHQRISYGLHETINGGSPAWPLRNVWLGVSAEDQRRADESIPHLLATPAAVRFVSADPLLGPVDFMKIDYAAFMRSVRPGSDAGLHEHDPDMRWPLLKPFEHWQSGFTSPGLDWIIVGGESGRDARPMHPDWARAIRDQCAAAGVPFFFKQWGEWAPTSDGPDKMLVAKDYILRERDAQKTAFAGRMEAGFKKFIPAIRLAKVGKRRAGRLLDGVEHNGFPSPSPNPKRSGGGR